MSEPEQNADPLDGRSRPEVPDVADYGSPEPAAETPQDGAESSDTTDEEPVSES